MGREIAARATRGAAAAFLLACGSLAGAAAPPPPALEMLWHGDDGLEWRAFDNAGRPLTHEIRAGRVPLGSLWKLFVYLWLVEERRQPPDYVCTGRPGASAAARKHREEEIYCCDPGQGIGRDKALLRSCGLFFEPGRLGIDPQAWRTFWEARPGVRTDAPWLADLGAMRPETVVSPASLLRALDAAPAYAREEAANLLLARLFSDAPGAGPGLAELVRRTGGQLRIKTFSWHRPGQPGTRYGGGAGWLADGRAVWFAGQGTGQTVLSGQGPRLAEALAGTLAPGGGSPTPGCVKVNFFARYPFELEMAGGEPAPEGILLGRHVARFQNGVSIPFTASGEFTFFPRRENERARLEGRFGLDDYVARVLDREADAKETEAARALSVVIRSYLLNEASRQGNCLAIDDSSRAQRVSINPPSQAARAVVGFSAGLVLTGAPVGYHSSTASENRLAWTEAVAASRTGQAWDLILQKSFPEARLTAMHDPAGLPCRRFVQAEAWLAARAPQWHRVLQQDLPGFEIPDMPRICLLPHGLPFSEQDRGRIHIRELGTNEDRITLAHEYLHLGLRHHPSGRNEALVERWARKLINGATP